MTMTRAFPYLLASLCAGLLAGCEREPPPPLTQAYEPLAQAIARGEDRVSPQDLADWIIQGRQDFVLVDVRPREDFEQGHIDDARHIPITELATETVLAGLPTDRRILVYSNGSENAAKAEVMLRLAGHSAVLLQGGYNAWQAQVLHPDLEQTDEEALDTEKRRAVACYFTPGATVTAPPPVSIPAFTPPVTPAQASPDVRSEEEMGGLMLDEGC
jgi:hypothetical protein